MTLTTATGKEEETLALRVDINDSRIKIGWLFRNRGSQRKVVVGGTREEVRRHEEAEEVKKLDEEQRKGAK